MKDIYQSEGFCNINFRKMRDDVTDTFASQTESVNFHDDVIFPERKQNLDIWLNPKYKIRDEIREFIGLDQNISFHDNRYLL